MVHNNLIWFKIKDDIYDVDKKKIKLFQNHTNLSYASRYENLVVNI